jgi:hypothetical protein
MIRFSFIMITSAIIFALPIVGVLYHIELLGAYGQMVDRLINGFIGLIAGLFGLIIADNNA